MRLIREEGDDAPQIESGAARSRTPTHSLYTVKGEGKHAWWTDIGAAIPTSLPGDFSLLFNPHPLGDRIVMRQIREARNDTPQNEAGVGEFQP